MPQQDDPHKTSEKPAGRVRHDSTGRAVWEWAVDSGRHAIESTSRLLKRLDMPGLSVSDYDPKKKDEAAPDPGTTGPGLTTQDPAAGGKGGFDPYNSKLPPKRGAPPPRKPAPPAKPRITQPVRPAKKPGLLARLFGKGR